MAGLRRLPVPWWQANAFVFRVAGLSDLLESALSLTSIRALRRRIERNELDREGERLSIVPGSVIHGSAPFKLGLPGPADPARADLTTRARNNG